MRVLRPILLALGVVAALMGALWIGQGLGYIRWPASSFMIDDRTWTNNGVVLAVVGLALILVARRMRSRRR